MISQQTESGRYPVSSKNVFSKIFLYMLFVRGLEALSSRDCSATSLATISTVAAASSMDVRIVSIFHFLEWPQTIVCEGHCIALQYVETGLLSSAAASYDGGTLTKQASLTAISPLSISDSLRWTDT